MPTLGLRLGLVGGHLSGRKLFAAASCRGPNTTGVHLEGHQEKNEGHQRFCKSTSEVRQSGKTYRSDSTSQSPGKNQL